MPDFQNPIPTITVQGEAERKAAGTAGGSVTVKDEWRRRVAPGRTLEMDGAIYPPGAVILLTRDQAADMERLGYIVPMGQEARKDAEAQRAARVVEMNLVPSMRERSGLDGT